MVPVCDRLRFVQYSADRWFMEEESSLSDSRESESEDESREHGDVETRLLDSDDARPAVQFQDTTTTTVDEVKHFHQTKQFLEAFVSQEMNPG